MSFDISGGTAPLKKLYLVCQGEENAPMINPVVAGLTEFKDCTLYINGTPKTIPNGITWYRAPAGSGIDGGEGYDLISQKDAKRVAKITASVFRKGGLEPLAVLESRKGE